MDPVYHLTETQTSSSVFSRFNKISAVALAAIAVGVALAAVAIFISMPLLFIPAAILTAIGGTFLLIQCCFNRHVVSEAAQEENNMNEWGSYDDGVASDAYDEAYRAETPPPTYQDSDEEEISSTSKTVKKTVRLGEGFEATPVPIPVPTAAPTSPLVPFPIPPNSSYPMDLSFPLPTFSPELTLPSSFPRSFNTPAPTYGGIGQTVNASITTGPGEIRIGESRSTTVNVSEHYHNGRRVDTASQQAQDQGYVFV